MKTIPELVAEGYAVKVTHYRYLERVNKGVIVATVSPLSRSVFENTPLFKDLFVEWGSSLSPFGGKTVVTVSSSELPPFEVTMTANCSEKDRYSKKIGTAVALGRALKFFKL